MKRVALFVAFVALGACAKKDEAKVDSSTAMAPTMAPPAAMTDSAKKADSIKMADSMAMGMKKDTTKH
ncbi:MAG: hypothetical protein ABJB66_11825 [Gemmatimonadaceae bacterium]